MSCFLCDVESSMLKASRTPISSPLFAHADSNIENGFFCYGSILGMLTYLVNYNRPEFTFLSTPVLNTCSTPRHPAQMPIDTSAVTLRGQSTKVLFSIQAIQILHSTAMFMKPTITLLSNPFHLHHFSWKCFSALEIKTYLRNLSLGDGKKIHQHKHCYTRSRIYVCGFMFEIDNTFKLGIGDIINTISTGFEDNSAAMAVITIDLLWLTAWSKWLAV